MSKCIVYCRIELSLVLFLCALKCFQFKLLSVLDFDTARTIVTSLVHSRLVNCNFSNCSLSKSQLNRLQHTQNALVRAVVAVPGFSNHGHILTSVYCTGSRHNRIDYKVISTTVFLGLHVTCGFHHSTAFSIHSIFCVHWSTPTTSLLQSQDHKPPFSACCTQWRREGGRRGHSPRAALCKGQHFEGRKYVILKFSRLW